MFKNKKIFSYILLVCLMVVSTSLGAQTTTTTNTDEYITLTIIKDQYKKKMPTDLASAQKTIRDMADMYNKLNASYVDLYNKSDSGLSDISSSVELLKQSNASILTDLGQLKTDVGNNSSDIKTYIKDLIASYSKNNFSVMNGVVFSIPFNTFGYQGGVTYRLSQTTYIGGTVSILTNTSFNNLSLLVGAGLGTYLF